MLLSDKGYIILQLRKRVKDYKEDAILVYSINGIKVIERILKEQLNTILLEPTTHYYIFTGGLTGITKRIFIITMEEEIIDVEKSPILYIEYIDSNRLVIGFNNKLKYLYWELKDT